MEGAIFVKPQFFQISSQMLMNDHVNESERRSLAHSFSVSTMDMEACRLLVAARNVLILKWRLQNRFGWNKGKKLTPKWEGPFKVRKEVGRGANKLETLKGKEIPRTWNAASLRIAGYKSGNSTKLTIDSSWISPIRATYIVGHGFASDKSYKSHLHEPPTRSAMDSPQISPIRATYTVGHGFASDKSYKSHLHGRSWIRLG
ncbi:hypothetical protein CR513_62371, partial [Mucuna pruriens]